MSSLFQRNISNDPKMQKQTLVNRYTAARMNLLLMIICSVINIIMLTTNSGTYFLFSASVPYILIDFGMFFCGMYPDEMYTGEFAGMEFADKSLFTVLLVISILILGIYLLCWFFSKKNKVNWLTAALVLFSFDTVVLLMNYGLSAIIDLAFHIWVIVILAMGISAHKKLSDLPREETVIEGEFTEITEGSETTLDDGKREIPDSAILRPADTDVKSRTLLEYEAFGHKVTYRRVKRTNELVIDGNVYGEYTALVEMPHTLTANLGGHEFTAGTNNDSRMYITVDGETAVQKMRLI